MEKPREVSNKRNIVMFIVGIVLIVGAILGIFLIHNLYTFLYILHKKL